MTDNADRRSDALKRRIARERTALDLRPWEFSPSEIDDGPNPYRVGVAGWDAWEKAKRLRAALAKAKRGQRSGR